MNKILNMQKGLLLSLMAFFALGFTACSDSDGGGGQPDQLVFVSATLRRLTVSSLSRHRVR